MKIIILILLIVFIFLRSPLSIFVLNDGIIKIMTNRPYAIHDHLPNELNLIVAKGQRVWKCGSFSVDPWIVYSVPNECFECYLDGNEFVNRLVYVSVLDEDSNPCNTSDVMNDIFEQIARLKHNFLKVRIYNLNDEYFVYIELNANWMTPCTLYYYNQSNRSLVKLCGFENRQILGIHVLLLEKLHSLK